MPSINERLLRRDNEDIIFIGDLVEKHYVQSEFGAVLTALTQGRINEEALMNKNGTSADRILGRIEMAAKLTQDLEQFIEDRDRLQRPVKRKRRKKSDMTPIATEPDVPEQSTVRMGGDI